MSINGTLIEVDGEGAFTTSLLVEEGPNLIEVLASNLAGQEAYQLLTVIYIP